MIAGGEEDADDGPDAGPGPRPVLGGLLVLVDVDLAVGVLGDERRVIGAHDATGVQLLEHLVVLAGVCLGVIGRDVEEDRFIGHVVLLCAEGVSPHSMSSAERSVLTPNG